MWSSGTRLADSAKIVRGGLVEDDLPEYMVSIFLDLQSQHAHQLVTSVEAHRGVPDPQHVDDVGSQPLGHPR
jgi:hypothetical protein